MAIRLYFHQPATIFAARVNQASFTYPIDEVDFDGVTTGAFGDILVGMTVLFGTTAGEDDLGRQRIRKVADSDTIFFGRSSEGNRDGEVDLQDDAHITVLSDFRVWSKIGFIDIDESVDPVTSTIYKDSDIAYTDENENNPPVANLGVGTAATINGSNIITVNFDSANSYAVADGASISSYLWNVDDGTITVGTSTSSSITATFPAGFRWVSLQVTDSNGNTHTARCPVYARDPDSDTTISAFTIERHRITAQGQEIAIRVLEGISEANYPDGMLVMLWEDEPADGDDRSHMMFIGWHQTDPAELQATRTVLLQDTVLDCVDVAGRLKTLWHQPIRLIPDDTPADWSEMLDPTFDKLFHYILHWHSTALDLADFTDSGTGSSFQFPIRDTSGSSIFDAVNRNANAMTPKYHFVCNTLGQLAITVDPMEQETAGRTSTVQATLTEADWSAIDWTHQRPPTISELWTGAVQTSLSSITALFSNAPGHSPGQGLSRQDIRAQERIAPTQATLNKVTGHMYARLNALETPFRIVLAEGDDKDIEPADLTWVQLDIGAAYAAQRKLTFSNERGLPLELNIRYNHGRTGLTRTVELLWERETSGVPGATYTPPQTDNPPDEPPPDYFDDNYGVTPGTSPPPLFQSGPQEICLVADGGAIYRTDDFQTLAASGGPTWDQFDLGFGAGDIPIYDFSVDPFSPGYLGTGTEINGYIVTESSIYRINDMFAATPTTTLLHTFTFNAAAAGQWRAITASFGRFFSTQSDNPWIIVVSHYVDEAGHTGTWAIYSKDAGATWSSEVQITSHYATDGVGVYEEMDVYASPRTPGFAITTAYSSTGADPSVLGYYTDDWGATWQELSPQLVLGNRLSASIHVPWEGNANEAVQYYQLSRYDTPIEHDTLRRSSLGDDAISPNDGTRDYAPGGRKWSIRSSDIDGDKLIMAGRGNDTSASTSGDRFSVWGSTDAGNNWDQKILETSATKAPRTAVFVANSDTEVLVLGRNWYVHYSDDFVTSTDDKEGNLATLKGGNVWIRGVCGGLT